MHPQSVVRHKHRNLRNLPDKKTKSDKVGEHRWKRDGSKAGKGKKRRVIENAKQATEEVSSSIHTSWKIYQKCQPQRNTKEVSRIIYESQNAQTPEA